MGIFPGRRLITRYVDVTRRPRQRKARRGRPLPPGVKAPRASVDPRRRPSSSLRWGSTVVLGAAGFLVLVLLLIAVGQSGARVFDRGTPFAVCLTLLSLLWVVDVFGMKKERLWRRKTLRPRARMRFGERGAATTCAYCHDTLDRAVDCPGCEASYHPECNAELGGCATLGCDEAPRRVRLQRPQKEPKA